MDCCLKALLPKAHREPHELKPLGKKDGQPVLQCEDCGLVVCPQGPGYLALYTEPQKYFKVAVGVGYKSFEDRFRHDYEVSEVRVRNLCRRVGTRRGNILDIGCGNGAFLKRAKELGFNCYGVDLDEWVLEHARWLVEDVRFLRGELPKLKLSVRFDVIAFVDSFEHLVDPLVYVKEARRLLRANGLVVVETPDLDSDGWKNRGLNWRHLKPVEHPFLYSESHIQALFGMVGMKIVGKVYTIPGRGVYFLR